MLGRVACPLDYFKFGFCSFCSKTKAQTQKSEGY